MKKLLAISCLAMACIALYDGCKNPQATALNTLSTAELTTKAAYDGYLAAVVKGTASTNDVPKISRLFNTFQADMVIAVVAVNGNTNAVAPASIIAEGAAVVSQITTSQGGK